MEPFEARQLTNTTVLVVFGSQRELCGAPDYQSIQLNNVAGEWAILWLTY